VIESIRSWTRHLYRQIQHWGQSKNCIRDLTILTVISSIIVPVPIEPFLIAIVIAAPYRWFRAAAAATIGTTVGGLVWYVAGRLLFVKVAALFHYVSPNTDWEKVRFLIQKDGMVFLGVAAFTPGFFRVAMLTAGAIAFNPLIFTVSVVAGRGTRFMLEASLLRLFGRKLSPFLEKYFDIVTLGLGATAFILLIMIKLVNR
jgi:membrane protein YqaA with SNARE-associated domain